MTESTIAVIATARARMGDRLGCVGAPRHHRPVRVRRRRLPAGEPGLGAADGQRRRHLRPHRRRGHAGTRVVLRCRPGEPAELRRDLAIPVRLLGIGLVLSVILGSVLAGWILGGLPWALAGFVGAALAPTDAALSVEVINDERIPLRLRRALNVESGLNDGIATPIVAFMLAVAASQLGIVSHSVSFEAGAALRELGGGVIVGVAVGIGGAVLISTAARRGWMMSGGRRLATLAVAVAAFAVRAGVDANGFIAAFVAGIAFGAPARPQGVDLEEAAELPELGGELLAPRRLVPVRRHPRPPRLRRARRADRRLRRRQPDGHPHAPGRAEPRALGARPAQRRVHRLVRSARTCLGRVRLAGHRGVGARPHLRSGGPSPRWP